MNLHFFIFCRFLKLHIILIYSDIILQFVLIKSCCTMTQAYPVFQNPLIFAVVVSSSIVLLFNIRPHIQFSRIHQSFTVYVAFVLKLDFLFYPQSRIHGLLLSIALFIFSCFMNCRCLLIFYPTVRQFIPS